MRTKRVSHPNMKPGQRKHRPDPLAQWMDDMLLLARAEAALAETPEDDPRREQLETGIAFLRGELGHEASS
jgi:hypothetical protein